MKTGTLGSENRAALHARVTYAAALEELRRVHQIEQARLLREACRLRVAESRLGRIYTVPLAARDPWPEACRDEIATARSDGMPAHPLLGVLAETPPDRWPSASVLARRALRLDPCPSGRLGLARALVSEGRSREAIAVLCDLLRRGPERPLRPAVLESLGLSHESVAEPGQALGWYEAALGEPRSDPRVAVSMLSLALRRGDRARVDIALQRLKVLDASVPGTERRLVRAIRAAREREAEDPSACGFLVRAKLSAEAISELVRKGRGASSALARVLLWFQ